MTVRYCAIALAVVSMVPLGARAQNVASERRISAATIAHLTDSLAEDAVRPGTVAGLSIAVVRGRDTVVMKGYGSADLENHVAATPATVYRIGSVTKQFTSVAIMQLVEQGKLSLDDEITKYVPNAPTHGRRILVRHLLNHTSGIPSYTDVPAFGRVIRVDLSHDSLLAVIRRDSLQFEPGTHFYYNNTGYYLLGMIIENITGQSYGEYLQRALFTPHGLAATVYCSEGRIIDHRADGYARGQAGLTNADYISMALPFAAGSLCSTIGDLVRWTQLLHGGALVQPSSFARMTTPVTLPSGRTMTYGYGLTADSLGSHRRIHHGGGINGFISELAYYPDDSLTVVVLSNTAPAPANRIADQIARAAFGMSIDLTPPPPADLAISASERSAFTGRYRLTMPDGTSRGVAIWSSGEQLMMQLEGEPRAVRLMKQSRANTFALQGQPGRLRFDVANGQATGFVMEQGSRPLEAVRVGAITR